MGIFGLFPVQCIRILQVDDRFPKFEIIGNAAHLETSQRIAKEAPKDGWCLHVTLIDIHRDDYYSWMFMDWKRLELAERSLQSRNKRWIATGQKKNDQCSYNNKAVWCIKELISFEGWCLLSSLFGIASRLLLSFVIIVRYCDCWFFHFVYDAVDFQFCPRILQFETETRNKSSQLDRFQWIEMEAIDSINWIFVEWISIHWNQLTGCFQLDERVFNSST